ncbi:hypothetical protein M514_06492 [Trichuris suis]|uniref:Uncharacterized protein n=1 Tax=Trichuris suis TaxID=68888 RepID=A0A085M5Z9_9BILA|nr:hypothetical protein M513_06492 [Trichuris suis]KFD63850.1 hypothetical protein M514_06492 [Trichuris suis]
MSRSAGGIYGKWVPRGNFPCDPRLSFHDRLDRRTGTVVSKETGRLFYLSISEFQEAKILRERPPGSAIVPPTLEH